MGDDPTDAGPPRRLNSLEDRNAVVESALDKAIRRGDFDDLPGLGKPLTGLHGSSDPDWWIKQKMDTEGISGVRPGRVPTPEGERRPRRHRRRLHRRGRCPRLPRRIQRPSARCRDGPARRPAGLHPAAQHRRRGRGMAPTPCASDDRHRRRIGAGRARERNRAPRAGLRKPAVAVRGAVADKPTKRARRGSSHLGDGGAVFVGDSGPGVKPQQAGAGQDQSGDRWGSEAVMHVRPIRA